MDHLEGPLEPGSKRGLFVLLITTELEPAASFHVYTHEGK